MSTVANILTGVEGRTGQTISSSSDPSTTTCIQFLNESFGWILGICAEEKSELGRTTGSITTVDGTSTYDDLSDMYAPYEFGWVLKTNSRSKIKLTTQEEELNRNPSQTGEPDMFYVEGDNDIVLLDTPDAAYTVKIPYWAIPTTLDETTDTMPFNGIFDNLLIEWLAMRIQNRDEYDLSFELKWMSFLTSQARRVIQMRKGRTVSISL